VEVNVIAFFPLDCQGRRYHLIGELSVKFHNKVGLAALIALGITAQAQAADLANIDFSGLIGASTCEVSIDGSGDSKEIALPEISVSSMKAAVSSPAMKTNFQITVKNCATAPAGGAVAGTFSTNGSFNSTSKVLLNTVAAGDQDSGFQVEDTSTNTAIDFNSATPQSSAPYDATNGAVFNYTVGYLYTGSGTPTVGQVKANTTFTTTYP